MRLQLNDKILVLLLFLCAFPLSEAVSQTITENQPLTFGRYVMADNSAPRTIELLPGGGYTADPEYIFFTEPELGNITVDSYPPSTVLTITIGTTNLVRSGGGGAKFSLTNGFTVPAVVTTDGTGSATFDIGATLTSDGTGVTHTDNNYSGTYSVTVTP